MKRTRKRHLGIAAALSTIAIAAPVSTAGAAVGPGPFVPAGWDGVPAVALPVTGPGAGQAAALIGPTIITTAPTTFINTNNQVSAADNWSGGQAAP
jgi:hypothetical protein